jgi:diaminopimelate decarboxylase
MDSRLSAQQMSTVLAKALVNKQFSHDDSAIIFQDLSFLGQHIRQLKKHFPDGTLHAIAAKANPLPAVLNYLLPQDVGVECATLSEVFIAQKCGYDSEKIIFDSPAKTLDELEYALKAGIHINADSFNELERIKGLLGRIQSKSIIGLRVNPQVGAGKISITSVAGKYSKFGVPIAEFEEDIITFYKNNDWLTGIHMHIGSQGCSLGQLIEAAQILNTFLSKIKNDVKWVDIGGGLPVEYAEDESAPPIQKYVDALKENVPELFQGHYKLITEFGRFVHANAGWTASRVEYVKSYSAVNTVVTHVGADQLMRRCYQPETWYHDLSIADKTGKLKPINKTEKYTIAGPLCFGGDIIAREIELPIVEEGDFILIHDTGAYTLSMWSRHTSRQIPKVLGYQNNGEQFEVLKKRESLEDVYNFWR